MDRLHSMEVFVAVADAGSFAEAARRLGLSPPAITRAVASLEERLGAELLARTTRSLRLTEAGARFLDDARRILVELDDAERLASGADAAPSGHLTLSAPVALGRLVVTPLVSDFLRAHPKLTASVMMLDRMVSLVDEGIDLAVRIGELPDSTLIARRVGEVRRVLVASPDYLARQGVPAHPRDLGEHSIVAFSALVSGREWRYREDGRGRSVVLSPRLELNDAAAAIAAAARGDGITQAVSYMVAREIATKALVPVLDTFAPAAVPVQLVYPQSRLPAPKVKAFVDFAAPRLAEALEALRIPPTSGAGASRASKSRR